MERAVLVRGLFPVEPRGARLAWFGKGRDFESSVRGELAVLHRMAKRMGCSADEADDLVQSTLYKAFRAWESFDGRHLRSWLIRILRNERLMELRQSTPASSLDDDDALEVPIEPFWNELSWKLEADRLMTELDNLPEMFRTVIQLCDIEDMTYEEVAVVLDIPVGTVRSRLFRARVKLRNLLTGESQEEPL